MTPVERLEPRQMLSASLNSTTHILTINGSSNNDAISVTLNSTGTKLVVKENSVTTQFTKSAVTKIKAMGQAGNDTITVAQNITIPSELFSGPNGPASGAGNEFLNGGGGNDILHTDFVFAGVIATGGAGNDTFYVGTESTNRGGAGNDTFYVNNGFCESFGDAGDDRFVMKPGTLDYNLGVAGGAGLDTADFSNFYTNLTIGNSDALHAKGLYGYAGPGANPSAWEGVLLGNDMEVFKGGHANDRLYGSSIVNQLYGNDGNDILDGGGGADAMFGGNGDDTFYSRDGFADFLSGGYGTDKAKKELLDSTTGVEAFLT